MQKSGLSRKEKKDEEREGIKTRKRQRKHKVPENTGNPEENPKVKGKLFLLVF